MSPEQWRWLQKQAELAEGLAQYYKPFFESEHIQQLVRNATRYYEQSARAMQGMPPPATVRAIEDAARILESRGFQDYIQKAQSVLEFAEKRFGHAGLAAAQRVAARHARTEGPAISNDVAERIQGGQTDQLLDEAARLAASPEVRETIESAEKDAILKLEEQEREGQEATTSGEAVPETEALGDLEGVQSELSREQLLAINDACLRLLWVLGAALSAALIATNPAVSIATLLVAINGLSWLAVAFACIFLQQAAGILSAGS